MGEGVEPAPSVKGAAIREFLRWYVATHGEGKLERIVAALPADARRLFQLKDQNFGVLPSSWYPAPAIHQLLDGITAGLSPSERNALARDGAQALIRATLRGVYKLLFEMMMSPERYARNAQKLFSRYHNTGHMLKIPEGPHCHRSEIRDWTGHHPLLCDFILYTGEIVYGAMGCRDVQLRKTSCVSEGGRLCTFMVTWR